MRWTRFGVGGIMATVFALAGLLASPTAPVRAATITVNTLNDTVVAGSCSLRGAIQAINTLAAAGGCPIGAAGDTITFSVAGAITLTSPELALTRNMTITGPGAANLTVRRDPLNGTRFRIFNVGSGVTAAISGLTITGGAAPDSNFGDGGNGGGVFNSGTLTVTNSTVSGNTAGNGGNGGGGYGGGVFNSGTLTVTNGTVSGNTGRGGGGGITSDGTLTLTNSTLSGNAATGGGGGGISGGGGGISGGGTLTLTNSTVSGNTGRGGGGIATDVAATLTLRNSTVSGNTATTDSGGGVVMSGGGIALTLVGTILAGNTGPGGADLYLPDGGTVTDDGYNLLVAGGSSGHTFANGTNVTVADTAALRLDPLAANGGPTQTRDPQATSPAINVIPFGPVCPAADQRGFPRPQGTRCDIGAVERLLAVQPLIGIAVTPNPSEVAKGATRQFTATGTYSDGTTANLTSSATWNSSTSNATITATGLATGVATGTTTITASASGVTSAGATLTVTVAALVSVSLSPTNASLPNGTTQQYTVTARFSDMSVQNVTASASFTSGDATVATITNPGGLATAHITGNTTISANYMQFSAPSASLTVTAGAADTLLIVAPTNAVVGQPVSVTITARDVGGATATGYTGTVQLAGNGLAVPPAPVTFAPADMGAKTVAVTFGTAGMHTITATAMTATSTITGTSGSVTVRLPAPQIAGLTVTSGPTAGGTRVTISGANIQTGATVTFGGTLATVPADAGRPTTSVLTVLTPAHAVAAMVSVTVTNPDGQSATYGGFTYLPPGFVPTMLPRPAATTSAVSTPAPAPARRATPPGSGVMPAPAPFAPTGTTPTPLPAPPPR